MSFPLGRPVLVMLVVALASGTHLLLRPAPPAPDLVVWTFSPLHARVFTEPMEPDRPSLVEQFEQETGQSVQVDLMSARALDLRLMSLLMSGRTGATGPDLVEVEIGSVGTYFRAPADRVGFMPLNRFLTESNRADTILPARLATYTKQGQVFGIPFDVHPVTLTYRRDLWSAAGIDLATIETWDQFHAAGLRYQTYWRAPGIDRRAIELPRGSADMLEMLLLQRGVNLIDEELNVHFTDPRVADTVARYAQLVAGPQRIATNPATSPVQAARDLADGSVGAIITPDWRIDQLKLAAPDLAGRLAMIALPRFDDAVASTSTWGGTMLAIPRTAPDPQHSWDLLARLSLDDDALQARERVTEILPPSPSHWTDDAFQRHDPFFGGQRIGALYADLAPHIPTRALTPYSAVAGAQLSVVLSRAARHVDRHGDDGLDDACHRWLADAQEDLERLIAFGEDQ